MKSLVPAQLSSGQTASRIPTNIITGFLGVGKTTAIRHLLANKPVEERWSVLVNEFGEVGIDGALLQDTGAVVREVPGGCICCVGGLPMKMALNMLIAKTKPDRLLIEPTGLGHPAEIIATLIGEYYDEVLDLRATITLVDPRKLADSRYTDHTIFRQQLAVADVLVANKSDVLIPEDKARFEQWTLDSTYQPQRFQVSQGALALSWLDFPRHASLNVSAVSETSASSKSAALRPEPNYNLGVSLPDGKPYVRRDQAANGYYSCGWMITPDWIFSFDALFGWLSGVFVRRAKAVMHTDKGIFMFNAEDGVLSVNELVDLHRDDLIDSRLELLHDEPLEGDALEVELFHARLPNT
jgi:G3E family GTPase